MATETLLDAVEATGAGSSVSMGKFTNEAQSKGSCKSFTVEVTASGAPTAVTMDLEGSIDGTNFGQLAQHVLVAGELTAKLAIFHVINKPVYFVRANMTTFTQAASETITVKVVGHSN